MWTCPWTCVHGYKIIINLLSLAKYVICKGEFIMGRIPPVQIDWGLGCNEELCSILLECKEDNPDSGINYDSIIGRIKKYGRVKEDSNGEYDSLYLYEREASDIIYALLYNTISLSVAVDCRTEALSEYKSICKDLIDICECYEDECNNYKEYIEQHIKQSEVKGQGEADTP